MILPITHRTWQTLRACLRINDANCTHPAPAPGAALRVTPTRFTQGGRHLPGLVAAGLLEVVSKAKNPSEATYRITQTGRHAAEYGEYEAKDFPPANV